MSDDSIPTENLDLADNLPLDTGSTESMDGNSMSMLKDKKQSIIDRIGEKLGIEKDAAKRAFRKGVLVASAVFALISASACTKTVEPFDLWSDSNVSQSQVMAFENNPSEKEVTESPELEEIWNRAIEFWPEARFEEVKEKFFVEAKKYSEIYPKYSPELLLPIFLSVAMTESNGGNNLGPNQYSGARGWFQVIPEYHLDEFNVAHGKNYTADEIITNDAVSIEVGTWALMRYASGKSITDCLKFFKGGAWFGENPDDGLWWNRVSYSTSNLMGGRDILCMDYMDYDPHDGSGIHPANHFLQNQAHIGNVIIPGSLLNGLVVDNLGN